MLSERATDRGRTDDRLFRSPPQRRVASGNDNTSKQLGAQDRGVIAQIGRENGNEVATQERASAACRHAIPAWVAEVHARRASVVMLELWKGADRQQGYDVEAALIADYTALGMADLNTSNTRGTHP